MGCPGERVYDLSLDLHRQDRPAPAATILEKCIRLDNVGFIGTENIIGSNRWREGFSDFETRKLFLFENRYICIPCCQQIPAVLPAGPPPTIFSYTSRLSASTIDSLRRVGRLLKGAMQSTFNAHDRGNGGIGR